MSLGVYNEQMEAIAKSSFLAKKVLRTARYTGQFALANWLLGRTPPEEVRKKLPEESVVLKDLWELFNDEYQHIRQGRYSVYDAGFLNEGIDYLKSWGLSVLDLATVRRRQTEKRVLEVPEDSLPSDTPQYYKQNFHYQTDGWFSDHSAEIYDYQVEVVFGGAAQVMRRQALPVILDELDRYNTEGKQDKDLKVLDLACGTGRLAVDLKHNRPDISLSLLDGSSAYLKKARKVLRDFSRCDFVESLAEKTPFLDDQFDLAFCVYLFHELPERIRGLVAEEMARTIKAGGSFVLVDSLQLNDKPAFNASLEYFPQHYHEPYYTNYIKTPLEKFFTKDKWAVESERYAFYSKIVHFRRL